MHKVLAVEDDFDVVESWIDNLIGRNDIDLILAPSIDTAFIRFRDNPDIEAIIMDACVPGNLPNTMGLVQRIRTTFKGPIIAVSSMADNRTVLRDAGCDYDAEKHNVITKLLEILKV